MKMKRKSLIALLVAGMVIFTPVGEVSINDEMPWTKSVSAAENVAYLDENGQLQTAPSAIEVQSDDTVWGEEGKESWYVVPAGETVTLNHRVEVLGTVNLILSDDSVLLSYYSGIRVNDGNTFIISEQKKQNGELTIIGSGAPRGDSCIGNDRNAKEYENTIIINGGVINVKNGYGGAAIGGCYSREYQGKIIINGGNLTAIGAPEGAAIGGGSSSSGGTIEINGGSVLAVGGHLAAGIGGGNAGDGGTITINGGYIKAIGGNYEDEYGGGAGIGGGTWKSGGSITINGGIIEAYGQLGAAGIGGGPGGDGGTININGGIITAVGGGEAILDGERDYLPGAGIGAGGQRFELLEYEDKLPPRPASAAVTIGENAVVFATGGQPLEGSDASQALDIDILVNQVKNSIVVKGASGQVYGKVTPSEDFTILRGKNLTIPAGSTLDVRNVNVTNLGTIHVYGTLLGHIGGMVYDHTVSSLDALREDFESLKSDGVFSAEEQSYLELLFDAAEKAAEAGNTVTYQNLLALIREVMSEFAEEEEEPYTPSAPISDGFHEYSLGTMLYQDGKRVKGLYEYNSATYFFNEQGFMQTECWIEFDEGWRYFAEDGKMVTGWLQLGNVWYYLDPETGLMFDDGLAIIGKSTYYFYDWGGMASDWWYEASDGWYFFGGSGAMKTAQWTQWKGEWYYLTETGRLAVDTPIGGYTVNAGGVWVG